MAEDYTRVGDSVTVHGRTLRVGAQCPGEVGHWHCSTHDQTFANNMQANAHTDDEHATHLMVWLCIQHGPEAQHN